MTRAHELAQPVMQALYEKVSIEQAEAAEGCLFEIVRLAADAERLREALSRVRAYIHPIALAADEDTSLTEARRIARAALEAAE